MASQTNKQPVSELIRSRIISAGAKFHAGSNISDFIDTGEKELLIDEAQEKFEAILDTLIVDRVNDPNSRDTGRRLAKMYINELFAGRYDPAPDVTAFPNTDTNSRFTGVLVAHAELKSMCSHHHQPVSLKAYIGIIPGTKVIGLSKYTRIAQHCARRGTLQEELTLDIINTIIKETGTTDVAVQLVGRHGCMENRGCMAHNSGTYTAEMRGQFHNHSIKDEYMHAIQQIQNMEGY